MLTKRKRRIYLISSLVLGVSAAVGLSLYALGQSIDLYYTPAQVFTHAIPVGREFRLGGMVVRGSVHRVSDTLKVDFVVTDYHRHIKVSYDGILPTLFREGQGMVASGHLNAQGFFVADQVLAKHDAKYHPPEIDKNIAMEDPR